MVVWDSDYLKNDIRASKYPSIIVAWWLLFFHLHYFSLARFSLINQDSFDISIADQLGVVVHYLTNSRSM